MHDVALRRLRTLVVPTGARSLPSKTRLGFLAELTGMGFTVRNPETLTKADPSFLDRYSEILKGLAALRGGDVDYIPLFTGFPDRVPDDDAYFADRVLGYVGNILGCFPETEGRRLDSGAVVPEWLFDLAEFGADPITQFQDAKRFDDGKRAQAVRASDTHVEWIALEVVPESSLRDRLTAWLQSCLYAASSIKEAIRADVLAVLDEVGIDAIDPARVVFRETRTLLMQHFWRAGELGNVLELAPTPTDLLRLFAALTDGDVSLSTKIRFPKLSRPQRRLVLASLERAPALPEDLGRYRGLWLAVGRGLHPGKHAGTYPKTAAAFAALRTAEIPGFESRVESAIQRRDVAVALQLLRSRPGALGRRLHELLRRFPRNLSAILEALIGAADAIPLKNLLVMRSHLASINDRDERPVINKQGRMRVLPNVTKGALSAHAVSRVCAVLDQAIRAKIAADRPGWPGRRVWVDPALDRITVPLQQRAASDGLLTFERGTRLPLDDDRVLRLFVWWRQAQERTDLDLSVLQFTADWDYAGHVSYTRLAADGIVHSGDIQSAPHGAAEFIDVTLATLGAAVAWIAPQVYRYCGDAFADMECRTGWMVRDRATAAYKSFDIATVQNVFALRGRAAYSIPFVVDLQAREIVLTDLYVTGRQLHNRVEEAQDNVGTLCREIADFTRIRPTMGDLARRHVDARGAILVDSRESAGVTFGLDGCDFNAAQIETIMAELL